MVSYDWELIERLRRKAHLDSITYQCPFVKALRAVQSEAELDNVERPAFSAPMLVAAAQMLAEPADTRRDHTNRGSWRRGEEVRPQVRELSGEFEAR